MTPGRPERNAPRRRGAAAAPQQDDLYFDGAAVQQTMGYVAWIDVLGTRSALLVSHERAANHVMRLHAATLAVTDRTAIDLFPMNDGVFAFSAQWEPLWQFMTNVLRPLVERFAAETDPMHRFMVRGAVAYGPLSRGNQLLGNNRILRENADHVSGVILGMPLTQAVNAEREAPPFGIVVHESARAFAPAGEPTVNKVLWRWWTHTHPELPLRTRLRARLNEHLDWVLAHPSESLCPAETATRLRHLATEYLDLPLEAPVRRTNA